ncbi:MAG TPA: hypothetical protein VNE58_11185 [Casimicrobiaceae bacterium]|nr:hypothetical protein [Casimicrobiaceae bacterium]
MKKLRIPLLLLLAVILPFKGGMAAAGVFCHAGTQQTAEIAAPSHSASSDAHSAHARHQATGSESSSHDHDEDRVALSTGGCTVCSALCSTPPLATAVNVHISSPAAAERFPALAAPRPSAVTSGLDRPPRTI